MVTLRKRKTPPPAPVRPAKKKAAAPKPAPKAAAEKVSKVAETVKEKVAAVTKTVTDSANGEKATAGGAPVVGDTIDLASFGGEIETNDGTKTTLAKLAEESKAGVVLFTYPKASTPGCESSLPTPGAALEPLC